MHVQYDVASGGLHRRYESHGSRSPPDGSRGECDLGTGLPSHGDNIGPFFSITTGVLQPAVHCS